MAPPYSGIRQHPMSEGVAQSLALMRATTASIDRSVRDSRITLDEARASIKRASAVLARQPYGTGQPFLS